MTMRQVLLGLALIGTSATHALAQGLDRVVAATRYENYSFDPVLVLGVSDTITKVTELTIPVGLVGSIGNRVTFTLSSGYARINTDVNNTAKSVSGVLDTEIRVGYGIVPGNLILVVTGVIPTGITSLTDVSVLAPLASDVVGFAAPSIGSGGSIGGGLVGAVPVGRWALGFGATYKYSLSYEPVGGTNLSVGPEFRVRAGLEGPIARRTYLRLAAVLATRDNDEIGSVVSPSGNRVIGYAALNQGFGNSRLTIYGFDVYRSSPSLDGIVSLPKGNLLVGGLRFDMVFGSTTVTPRGEFRTSSGAPRPSVSVVDPATIRAGSSVRFGLDLRQVLSPRFAVVLQADRVSGDLRDVIASDPVAPRSFSDFDGFRFGLFLTVEP